jgi:hypothetical protein
MTASSRSSTSQVKLVLVQAEDLKGPTNLAELVWPPSGEQRAAKFVHESACDLGPYHVCKNFETSSVNSAIYFSSDSRADAFRDVHDTLQVAI